MKILFVCLGNICRSPAAENIFRHLARKKGVEHHFTVESAGTEAWHTGKSPDSRMTQTLVKRGIKVSGLARQITTEDLERFDIILTMDDQNFSNVNKLRNANKYRNKIQKFTKFCENYSETEIPDPYYGGQGGFVLVADLLIDGCNKLLKNSSNL